MLVCISQNNLKIAAIAFTNPPQPSVKFKVQIENEWTIYCYVDGAIKWRNNQCYSWPVNVFFFLKGEVTTAEDKKVHRLFSSFQVKPFQKTLVTLRDVRTAQNAAVCSAWMRPARTPTTPPACATTAIIWMISRSSVNTAPNAPKARACCTAANMIMTQCARSATGTLTRTRKVLGSPASPALPVMRREFYIPALLSLILFVKVRQLYWCDDTFWWRICNYLWLCRLKLTKSVYQHLQSPFLNVRLITTVKVTR